MSGSDPERWLEHLDPIGWRLGLDRIRALLRELGEPQREFESAHVVGTNGKSSVTAMVAAILEAHGRPAGAYLSPHTSRWSQRVLLGGREIDQPSFAAASRRVQRAVVAVEGRLAEDERITQFEAATAMAFVAIAEARLEFGVIEAGLGGRLDATNVLPSRVTTLTSVGLDHTDWLGGSKLEIAAEKLAVLRPGTALVVGRLDPTVLALARSTAAEVEAELIVAEPADEDDSPGGAPYLQRNRGVARAVARTLLGELDQAATRRALEEVRLPGRWQLIEGDPPLLLDAAHNPDGAGALAEALGARSPSEPVAACLAVLADKDAERIISRLAPALTEVCCCEIPAADLEGSGRPGSESVPAAELARICSANGLRAHSLESPEDAIEATVERARALGGMALLAGSHYLLRYEWIARRAQSSCR